MKKIVIFVFLFSYIIATDLLVSGFELTNDEKQEIKKLFSYFKIINDK